MFVSHDKAREPKIHQANVYRRRLPENIVQIYLLLFEIDFYEVDHRPSET
jgi:hypothetical protein